MVYVVDYGIDVGTMAAGPQGNYLILLSVRVHAGGGGDPHGNAVRAFERDKSGGKSLQRVLATLGLSKQRRWKRAFCVSGMNLCHPGPAGAIFEEEEWDEDEDDERGPGGIHGHAIPGSVLELVRQKISGASSSPEKLALQTAQKRLLLAQMWAASTTTEAVCAAPGPTIEPEPEPQPQPEQELKPDPTAPGPRGLVRTSSGDLGAAAARQVMQQKAAAQKPLPAGKSKPKAKTKKPKAKSKKGKKALPSSWAADVTAAASWLPGEVYERIGSSVAATEQAAAASTREGLFVHGSAVFGFGKNTFGKNNMLLPKFLYELEAACKA